MIGVSNTTPLRYLIAIGREALFGRLFEKVLVPIGVHKELTDSRTPEIVRSFVLCRPSWLEVRTVPDTGAAFPVSLHRGEREAILLAEAVHADVLLIDEQIGRTVARSRHIPLSGTLGVLERADVMGFIDDFPQVLRQLKDGGFFIDDSLKTQLLDRHARRHK